MKAIVTATGDIVEVDQCSVLYDDGRRELMYGKELEEVQGTPDYWTKLEHQYAGMAMQGILACEEWKIAPREGVSFAGEVAIQAQEIAHALVEKYKEKEK